MPIRPSPRLVAAAALAAGLLLPAAGGAADLVGLELLAGGLTRPLGLTHAGDGSGRTFLLLQDGQVLIHDGERLLPTPFLDLSGRVSCCGERGLLGLAFHPAYRRNGLFFVNYTAGNGDTVVARFAVSADPDRADAASETEVLRFAQPFSNHNGGHLAFGPDGFLYVASGDGGSGGDPQNNGQRLDTLLGKLLRLDPGTFGAAAGNPFTADSAARDEIWAYGLRNPWRFSFDRRTGDLYIGDVGQNAREEIDFQPAASGGGENYGWRRMEGAQCFDPPSGCDDGSLVLPVVDYPHSRGCSVTGGYRYRGPKDPTLERFYVYGDFCSGRIWGARANAAGSWRARELAGGGLSISSFGEDERGRLYVVDYAGAVYRLLGRALFESGFEAPEGLGEWSRARGNVEVVSPGLRRSQHALRVTVDGSRARSFVESRAPAGESGFTTRFDLQVQRVDLAGGEVEILRLRDGSRAHLLLVLEQAGQSYRVHLRARDGDGWREVGGTPVPANRRVRLKLEWSRASGPGRRDGEAFLIKKGRLRAAATDLDNHPFVVDSVRLGLPAGSRGAAGGAFLIDDYLSTP